MKHTIIYFLIAFLLSCTNDSYSDLVSTETTINLKWNKAYPEDNIDKSLIGLKWALSYMGATLPSSNAGFTNTDNIITINIKYLGFTQQAQEKLLKLSKKIKAT